jgi:hypothetical protein
MVRNLLKALMTDLLDESHAYSLVVEVRPNEKS